MRRRQERLSHSSSTGSHTNALTGTDAHAFTFTFTITFTHPNADTDTCSHAYTCSHARLSAGNSYYQRHLGNRAVLHGTGVQPR